MIADAKSLQGVFLNHLRRNKVHVTIFLQNGVKLQGIITWFDNFCILLRRHDSQQLVYKHALATVMPRDPVDLRDELQMHTEKSPSGEGRGGTLEGGEESQEAENWHIDIE